jgi:hypothetical protein
MSTHYNSFYIQIAPSCHYLSDYHILIYCTIVSTYGSTLALIGILSTGMFCYAYKFVQIVEQ